MFFGWPAHSDTCCLLNHGSSQSEMEQLLCTCSGFLYVGMESLVANIPPATLAALNMSGTVKLCLVLLSGCSLTLNVRCMCCPTCDAPCRKLEHFNSILEKKRVERIAMNWWLESRTNLLCTLCKPVNGAIGIICSSTSVSHFGNIEEMTLLLPENYKKTIQLCLLVQEKPCKQEVRIRKIIILCSLFLLRIIG